MISVTIVDGQRGVRDSLQRLINSTGDCRCIGVFADAETAITGIPALRPNVVLMDVGLPSMSGIDCVKVLKRKLPELDIIMLSNF